MKRNIIIMIVIPAIICCGWFFQNRFLRILHNTAGKELEEIVLHLDDRNYKDANSLYEKYDKGWNKRSDLLSLLVSHEEIDDITRHNARLGACLNDEGETEALAVIGELNEIFKELDDKFRVNAKNIF